MRHLFSITLSIGLILTVAISPSARPRASASPASSLSAQIDITGPSGSERFGRTVTMLPNGNVVITDPSYDSATATDVGAVYLYNGATGAPISALTGSTTDDLVGASGVTVLSNGNYVVSSRFWHNDGVAEAGAVTWCSGTTGCDGTVSIANSLVGSATSDQIGYNGIEALSNGNYVVRSIWWNNGATEDAGAVTWGDGTTGITGTISAANSLIGSTAYDRIGDGVVVLSNGNYVVGSPGWDNSTIADVGAATWGDGTTGITGVVSTTNSLVGSATNDQVGSGVSALSNGNYVVRSTWWDNGTIEDAGAVTWGDGTIGVTGVVSATNSLVGSAASDKVGSGGMSVLSNGSYVVCSPFWDNGTIEDAGAVTLEDGTTGIAGVVSTTNSLVGSSTGDHVGYGVTALTNGNYVVYSPFWDNGTIVDAGMARWCSATLGCTGAFSSTNSLIGSSADDLVGASGVTVLSNGNYVVNSIYWDNGIIENVGAVTWGDGDSGITGVVSTTNSLVGFTAYDGVGDDVVALTNSSYVVSSPDWNNGTIEDAGAVTWGDGDSGITGVVSTTNSLVGSTAYDGVGDDVVALTNSSYVVSSPDWNNGTIEDAGAVTWGDGDSGITGVVSTTNSLVGSTAYDGVGDDVVALTNGSYVVTSPDWDNDTIEDSGAVTWGNGNGGTSGPVTSENSVRGLTAYYGSLLVFAYDPVHFQLVVGRPADNIVTLFRPYHWVFVPFVLKQTP